MSAVEPEDVERRTRAWVARVVLGLDLCPFAAGPWQDDRVRVTTCLADDAEGRLTALWEELDQLFATPVAQLETTLLVVPEAPAHFESFLSETDVADAVVERAGYEGLVQLVTFHPAFRFSTGPVDDPANLVNRSPFPMWHLLRADSITRVTAGDPGLGERISTANHRLLRSLDPSALRGLTDG